MNKEEKVTEGTGGRYTGENLCTQDGSCEGPTRTLQSKCLIQACGARCKVVSRECTWTLEENLARPTCNCLSII